MSIHTIIKTLYDDISLLEERYIIKVGKDSGGIYRKTRKKVCPVGSKWSSSENRCVKQSAIEKIARKKSGIKISRSRKRFSASKKRGILKTTQKTLKVRNNLVSKT